MNAVRIIRARSICPTGFSDVGALAALSVLACLPLLATSWVSGLFNSSQGSRPLMYTATRNEFLYETTVNGTLESSNNVEVQCEVSSPTNIYAVPGITILEIVPEGTYVQPGDVLVRLDASAWEDYRDYRKRLWEKGEAYTISYEGKLEVDKLALDVYRQGTFGLQQRTLAYNVVEAQAQYDQAKRYYENSQALHKCGYITKPQLEADRIAMEDANRKLTLADVKLSVLEDFSREKMIKRLENEVLEAQGTVKSRRATQEYYAGHVARSEGQIEKCTIRAPVAGQVVYAKEDYYGGKCVIEEGTQVRQLQTIIYLPDPERMQVVATINEESITKVLPGMTARITLDTRPDLELNGTVERVDYYPRPTSRYLAHIKEYETIIRIDDLPCGLRSGLSAEVKICIERSEDKVQVPEVAILDHDGSHYCILPQGRSWEARQVTVGSCNERFVVIEENLDPGEQIVLNASEYRDKVDLPEAAPPALAEPVTIAQM